MAYIHIDDKIEPYLDILIDCIKLNGKDIEKQVKRITEETDTMGECLEDNFLAFKLHSKKVRDEYEKAVNEEVEKSETVWRNAITSFMNQDQELKKQRMRWVIYLVRSIKLTKLWIIYLFIRQKNSLN